MKLFSEIIEIMKSLKGFENDYQVADILKIKPKSLATSKLRNSIPYEELASFCNKEGVSLNWLLTGMGPKTIINGAAIETFAEPPRHPAAAWIPIPPDASASGIDPAVQAMSDIKEIFDSGDPILIPAIQANLHAFKRALLRERQFEQILKENEELKTRLSNLEDLCGDIPAMKKLLESLQLENQALRLENKKLQDLNGGCAPISLDSGTAALTGTDDKKT